MSELSFIPPEWKPVGSVANTRYFSLEDVLMVVPNQGSKDDASTARINLEFQSRFAREAGRKVGLLVLLGRLSSQDSEARHIYAEHMDPGLFAAAALVVSNPISRAIGSFFLGLARPKMPTRIFESVDHALQWLRSQSPRAQT